MATMEKQPGTTQVQADQAQGSPSGFPVRKRLATPTDLAADGVEAVTVALNHLLADTITLYIKTKNFHWHLAGAHFRDYHLLFDEQADQLAAAIDPLAERVRRIGGTTIRSVGHVAELQSINDDDQAFVPAEDMIERLLDDNRMMAAQQRAAMELADAKRDHPTANLLQELLDETEKRVWFLYETSLDDGRAEESTRGAPRGQ